MKGPSVVFYFNIWVEIALKNLTLKGFFVERSSVNMDLAYFWLLLFILEADTITCIVGKVGKFIFETCYYI